MRQLLAAFGLVVALLPSSAFAQPTVSFQGLVTTASGPDAAVFTAGAPVLISYAINTNVGDNNPDPLAGLFFSASQSLSVAFPSLNVSALGTTGNVQTFNNYPATGVTSDQLFVFGGGISSASTLGGNPITSIEVDFLSDFLPVPIEPTMLSSDAIPLSVPAYDDAFVILQTSAGYTFVRFEVAGPTLHMTANGSDGPVTLAPGDPLKIDVRFDAPGTGLTSANVFFGVATPFGLYWLNSGGGFSTTPGALYSGALPDFGPSTFLNFASIAGFPAGSYKWFMLVQDGGSSAVGVDVVETIMP